MSELRRTISSLAEDFATRVLAAIRTASLSDIAALSGGRAGRPAGPRAERAAPVAAAGRRGGRRRRTAADIEELGGQILELLHTQPEGLRAEAIREELGVPRKELPRAFKQLLEAGSVRSEGQKRATTYFSTGEGSGARAAKSSKKGAGKRGGKRGGKRSGKRTKKAAEAAG